MALAEKCIRALLTAALSGRVRYDLGSKVMKSTTTLQLVAALVGILAGTAGVDSVQQAPPVTPQTQPPAQSGRGGAPVQGAEPDIPVLARFDRNGDKRLDYAERTAAREYLDGAS